MHRVFGKSRASAATAFCILLLLWGLPMERGRGQTPGRAEESIVTQYKNGLAAFERGDFEQAANILSQVIQTVSTADPALEAAYYDLAVAQYSLRHYPDAANAFRNYRTNYPKGSRLQDAAMSLANCYLGMKSYDAALKELQPLADVPALRDQTLLLQSSILAEQRKVPQAIQTLEALTKEGLRSQTVMRGALQLTALYAEKGDVAKANALVSNIRRNLNLVDNILRFNGLIIDLSDKLLAKGYATQALTLYHLARTREEVIAYQTERVRDWQKSLEQNKEAFRATKNADALATTPELLAFIADGNRTLADIKNSPNFEPAWYFRMARAYQQTGQLWEASLVYQHIFDQYPAAAAEREPALFGLISALTDLGKGKRALEACQTYLSAFPKGVNADAVAYLRGTIALDAGDYTQAAACFADGLKGSAAGNYRERMALMLGNARLLGGDVNAALEAYKSYVTSFPKGDYIEEAVYRIGLCQLFSAQYDEAARQFNDYLKLYPEGEFASDVHYRQAVIKFAAREYAAVITDCNAWLKANSGARQSGEVLALLADAYVATDKRPLAADTYIRSYQAALEADNDEAVNHSLFEAGKLLGKLGQWDKAAAMFEDFVKAHPAHPAVPAAVASLIQARIKLGQTDGAKAFAARTVTRFIADPGQESVENLLTQLAALCARKRPTADGGDPVAELESLLTFPAEANVSDSPTVRARRLFAQAELMTFLRKPLENGHLLIRIGEEFRPTDLSPLLLGQVGEALLAQNKTDPARAMFDQLIAKYPKSNCLDFGYVGLGELAMRESDYLLALRNFGKAVDEIPSSYRLKEATLGKARALAALNRLDEAAKLFEQIAATREWRGEATAQALDALGDIAAKRADYAKAIAYYQRVYVAYQRYPRWMAKAYLESARAFEKLGKPQEAINTYREMVSLEKLADSPETAEARKRLAELAPG